MTTVAVDLADLETLVMTTGALKVIEGAIQARKNDPFVQRHLEFTAAHNRLAAAMRNATRAQSGTAVNWDAPPLTSVENVALRYVDDAELPWVTVTPTQKLKEPWWDSLSSKGMIEMGQKVDGVIWPGSEKPELAVDPTGFAVRMTQRGRQTLWAIKEAAHD